MGDRARQSLIPMLRRHLQIVLVRIQDQTKVRIPLPLQLQPHMKMLTGKIVQKIGSLQLQEKVQSKVFRCTYVALYTVIAPIMDALNLWPPPKIESSDRDWCFYGKDQISIRV